jgi:hypothetical protein
MMHGLLRGRDQSVSLATYPPCTKTAYFDLQVSSIPQFTPLSLQMHSTILPPGTTQDVVRVLTLG